MADGSVHPITYQIDYWDFQSLATRAGGDVASPP
jgi:hypothetical protein